MTVDRIAKPRSGLHRAVLPALVTLLPLAARAEGAVAFTADPLWVRWSFAPLAWGLAGITAWLYLRGLGRSAARGRPVAPWRSAAFFAALVLILLALVSPIDFLAEHLFWVRQVQLIILHLVGPLLLFATRPQGVLFLGLGRRLRRRTLAPLLRNGRARRLGRAVTNPGVAAALFIAPLVLWELPAWHDAAVLHPALLALMQATMLAAGLLFFAVLLDPREAPEAATHGARMSMIIAAGIAGIAVGAVTMLKPVELYPAYDTVGRLFGWSATDDEATGGFLIWVPSVLIYMLAMFPILGAWNRSEERRWEMRGRWTGSNSAALMQPETAEELWMVVTPKNRRLALKLGLAAFGMFMVVMLMAETIPAAH